MIRAALERTFEKFRDSFIGLSPESIATIVLVGVVLGVFPVFGVPTLLCAAAAIAFRLNLPAIQLVNQISAPLQYALLLPLGRAGAHITGAGTVGSLAGSLVAGTGNAIVGWACYCLPAGLILYLVLAFALRQHREAFDRLENPV